MSEDSDQTNKQEDSGGLIGLFILAYLIPAIINLIWNFFSKVVFGGYEFSLYRANWIDYSFGIVNEFYSNIWRWFIALGHRLSH